MESKCTLLQLSPMMTSHTTKVKYQDPEVDVGTILLKGLQTLISFYHFLAFIRVCVCMCACNSMQHYLVYRLM